MKVIAVNSSPRGGGQSKTEMMLDALVRGMREGGADVEVVHLREKKINYCIGCYTCWTKTPGICIHRDDMTKELFPKWLESDMAVYASPLYHYTVNANMKTFIERTLPVVEPFIVEREGRSAHPLRHKPPDAIVLSVAGLPEMKVFDQLSSYVNFLYHTRLIAEIYRPAAETMTLPSLGKRRAEILAAVEKAGRELVESKSVAKETMEAITQPIGSDLGNFAKTANLMWKSCIAEGVTPKEFSERGMRPRPDSIETFLMIMPMGFNPQKAGDTKAVIQFDFSGETNGSCHFMIDHGKIHAQSGAVENPDLAIQAPFELWMDILTGKADGQQMFMAQKYTTAGDISLLMRMGEFFSR